MRCRLNSLAHIWVFGQCLSRQSAAYISVCVHKQTSSRLHPLARRIIFVCDWKVMRLCGEERWDTWICVQNNTKAHINDFCCSLHYTQTGRGEKQGMKAFMVHTKIKMTCGFSLHRLLRYTIYTGLIAKCWIKLARSRANILSIPSPWNIYHVWLRLKGEYTYLWWLQKMQTWKSLSQSDSNTIKLNFDPKWLFCLFEQ